MKYRFNIKLITRFLGMSAMLNGLFMLIAIPFSLYYQDGSARGIGLAGVVTLVFGFCLSYFNRNAVKTLQTRDGYLIVTLGWLILSLTGALPYIFTGSIPNFTDAFFETISGYSTTGASILNDIEAMPKGILFWRSATHWIGGMGIIVLTVAILPLLGIGGMQLFMAESPGPSTDKLHPRITETAKRLWLIYAGLTLAEFFLLRIAGMTWFDAINHAMATMSTGGFSTKNASIAFYNDIPLIQYIISVFMFIAGMNFVLTYFGFKGNFKKIISNEEFRWYTRIVLSFTVILTICIVWFQDPNLHSTIDHPEVWGRIESGFRHGLFQVLTIITTTGFVSADFTMWNSVALALIFTLFFVGGSAGSTSGGVKVVRQVIMIKHSLLELKKQLHPNAIIPVRYNGKGVHSNIVYNILSFFVLYIIIVLVSIFVFTVFGLDFMSALGVTISSLGNVGPGIGTVSPVENFSHLSMAAKWFSSFLMLIGRLELFTVLILLTPYFWKKN